MQQAAETLAVVEAGKRRQGLEETLPDEILGGPRASGEVPGEAASHPATAADQLVERLRVT